MNARRGLMILLALAVAAGGYWLYANVPLYALAVQADGQWHLSHTGWQVYLSGWFFLVPGVVLACVLLLPLVGWLYQQAEQADHREALSRLENALAGARERADTAEQVARGQYQQALATLEKREALAVAEVKKGREMQQKAMEYAKESQKVAEKATQSAVRATKKKNNAMGAAERIKRREARLSAK